MMIISNPPLVTPLVVLGKLCVAISLTGIVWGWLGRWLKNFIDGLIDQRRTHHYKQEKISSVMR
jgi:hypothetical protein